MVRCIHGAMLSDLYFFKNEESALRGPGWRCGVGGRGAVHATTQATATTTATISAGPLGNVFSISDYFGIIINQIIQYYEQ